MGHFLEIFLAKKPIYPAQNVLRIAFFVKKFEIVAFFVCCAYFIFISKPSQVYSHNGNNHELIPFFWLQLPKCDSVANTGKKTRKKKEEVKKRPKKLAHRRRKIGKQGFE